MSKEDELVALEVWVENCQVPGEVWSRRLVVSGRNERLEEK